MTNDLNNFLWAENEKFEKEFEDKSDERYGIAKHINSMVGRQVDWINYHDTRLINFVLDLVEKEVDKIEVKKFGRYTIEKDAEEIINTIVNETKKCVSTIINNLRV